MLVFRGVLVFRRCRHPVRMTENRYAKKSAISARVSLTEEREETGRKKPPWLLEKWGGSEKLISLGKRASLKMFFFRRLVFFRNDGYLPRYFQLIFRVLCLSLFMCCLGMDKYGRCLLPIAMYINTWMMACSQVGIALCSPQCRTCIPWIKANMEAQRCRFGR